MRTRSVWLVSFFSFGVVACGSPAADGAVEICSGGLDEDGDGYTDCADQDCWGLASCPSAVGDTSEPDVTPQGSDTPAASAGDALDDGLADASADGASEDVATDEDVAVGWTCAPCGTGSLKGKVCAPNEQIFVNAAKVALDAIGCDGNPVTIETLSDANGDYLLENVPCGSHLVRIDKGSFHHDYPVFIEAGKDSDITGAANKMCFRATSTPIAVFAGSWDGMEDLLDDLGLEYDLYSETGDAPAIGSVVALLSDPSALSKYDIVFANCGAYHGWMPIEHPEVMPNVRSYVLGGGSLYMSDYAWAYGEWSFPGAIEFMGSDDVKDMFTKKSPQLINGGQTVQGVIAEAAMAAYVGKESLPIAFDQGPQIAPEVAGPGTFPHISAHLKQFSFDTPIDATIPLVLSYRPEPTAGLVVYTNFHNDAQTTTDMLKILQYLVFTL